MSSAALFEELCEERSVVAPAAEIGTARERERLIRAEIRARPDAASAVAAALPTAPVARAPIDLHRHRVRCRIARETLLALSPDRAIDAILAHLESPDPDVAEAVGKALIGLAERDPSLIRHGITRAVCSLTRRAAIRALIARGSLGDLEPRLIALIPSGLDLDVVLAALAWGGPAAAEAVADLAARGDAGSASLALRTLAEMHSRGKDAGLLVPSLRRAVKVGDAKGRFGFVNTVYTRLAAIEDIDAAFALGDGERVFASPEALMAALGRWLDHHDRHKGMPDTTIGLRPMHRWLHARGTGGIIGRAPDQSFSVDGRDLYGMTFGTWIPGNDPHAIFRYADHLGKDEIPPLFEVIGDALAPASMARFRPGRYLTRWVEVTLTAVPAEAPAPFHGMDATVDVDDDDRDVDDVDEDEEDDDPDRSSFGVPWLISSHHTDGEWSLDLALLPTQTPEAAALAPQDPIVAYAWFRPAWFVERGAGTPKRPRPIRLHGAVLQGFAALERAAGEGHPARVFLVCPCIEAGDDQILERAFAMLSPRP